MRYTIDFPAVVPLSEEIWPARGRSAGALPGVLAAQLTHPGLLYRGKTWRGSLSRGLLVDSGCSPVFVDHAAEDSVAADRGVERDLGGGVVGWRVLAQALVRAMVIEVTHVLAEDGAGVSFVIDQ